MDERFSCRIELAQHIVPSSRAKAFAEILEPFDGNVMRLPDGRVYVDVVVPAHDVGEAAAQSVHLVTYAGRCAQSPAGPWPSSPCPWRRPRWMSPIPRSGLSALGPGCLSEQRDRSALMARQVRPGTRTPDRRQSGRPARAPGAGGRLLCRHGT